MTTIHAFKRPVLLALLSALALFAIGAMMPAPKASAATATDVLAANLADHDDSSDYTWDESSEVDVNLDDSSTTITGSGASFDSSTSTLTISAAGNYRLSGDLAGQVVVNAKNALVRLILDGASIESSSTSAIAVTKAAKAVVITADGSSNSLTDGSTYALPDDDPNAALFSKANMTLAGSGSLTVNGRFNDGIASKDGLIIHSGTIEVTAVDDGIRGKDYLVGDGGYVTVNATGDGLKSDDDEDATAGYVAINGGSWDVTSGDDGISAFNDAVQTGGEVSIKSGGGAGGTVTDEINPKGISASAEIALDGGSMAINSADDGINSENALGIGGSAVTIATGDDGVHADQSIDITGGAVTVTKAYEGVESPVIRISGGATDVTTSDDGINAASDTVTTRSITISGGTVSVMAQGDGIDSNGALTISGGTVVVAGPTGNDNASLDADSTLAINGGTVLAVGSSGMVQSPSSASTQGWLVSKLTSGQSAGTIIHVTDASDNILASYASTKAFQSVIYSSPTVTKSASYRIYKGGTATCPVVGGLTETGSISGATLLGTVTAGTAASGGGMGGGGGGSGLSSTTVASQARACGTTDDDSSDDDSSDDDSSDDDSDDDSTDTVRPTPKVQLRLPSHSVRAGKRARAIVTITIPSDKSLSVSGKVVFRDHSRVIASHFLKASADGKLKISLPKLARGRHRIGARIVSTSSHKAASSTRRTLTVR